MLLLLAQPGSRRWPLPLLWCSAAGAGGKMTAVDRSRRCGRRFGCY